MSSRRTLEQKIALRISKSKREVFFRKDFKDLGGYQQVGRCLRNLVQKQTLIRLGYGVYAKARLGKYFTKALVPRAGLDAIYEAVERLGVEIVPSTYQRLYNSGQSTQVPTGRAIGVKGRITRKLGYGNFSIHYEYSVN